MNSEEGMSLAKMAVTVLLVVLVIGAVVAIVYAAYAWYTKGTDKLTDQVVSIDKSSFSHYDNAQVSGSAVLSALKEYRESDIAIIVCNLNNEGGEFKQPDKTTTSVSGYNYCALINVATLNDKGEVTKTDPQNPNNLASVMWDDAEGYWYVYGLAFDQNDKVSLERNTNFSPTTTNGDSTHYVKQSANWYSNLITDKSTGDVCGILFRQMN